MKIITETDLPLKKFKKGKVRDIYEFNDTLLLIVTDRISAFDWVLSEAIPYKGICLTQLSAFWFNYFKDVVPSHSSRSIKQYYSQQPALLPKTF